MQKVFNGVFKSMEEVAAIALYAITAMAFFQLVARYFFHSSNAGVDEVIRLIFVWIASMGSALAFRAGAHLGVTALANKIRGQGRTIFEIGVNIVLIAFMAVILYAGITMTKMGSRQFSEYLRMSMAYFYGCIPFGAVLSIAAFIAAIFQLLAGSKKVGEEADVS